MVKYVFVMKETRSSQILWENLALLGVARLWLADIKKMLLGKYMPKACLFRWNRLPKEIR
jgi:hypothetical protein